MTRNSMPGESMSGEVDPPRCSQSAGSQARLSPARFTISSHHRSRLVTKPSRLQGILLDMDGEITTSRMMDVSPTSMEMHGSRVDMHCHSTASEESRLGVQRALGLPECATPPAEVYALAKRRGMDFVTITDHDTIAGVLEIAERPDVFVSVELTAGFRGTPQGGPVLCYGISAENHDWLQ